MYLDELCSKAKNAKYGLGALSEDTKNQALETIANALLEDEASILEANEKDALYDFDMDYAFRMYRLSDSALSLHLTWLNDDFSNAYTQSFILPVSMLRRVLSGKTVNAVVENDLRFYDPDVAREHLFMPRVIKACCM